MSGGREHNGGCQISKFGSMLDFQALPLILGRRPETYQLRKHAFDEFDRSIERLNETMGLCIK